MQKISDKIMFVNLAPEPDLHDALRNVMDVVREKSDCDVVLDFSAVDIVTSSSLSKLLKLRKVALDCGHHMVLCQVARTTRSIFAVTALEDVFDICQDRVTATAWLQAQPAPSGV